MATLASMNCVPCRGGEPQVTDTELAEYRQQVPEWQVIEVDGERRVQRVFRFNDFGHALAC